MVKPFSHVPGKGIRQQPLNVAGQSQHSRMYSAAVDQVLSWGIACALAAAVSMMEWIHWLTNAPPRPFFMTFLASIFISWVVIRKIPAGIALVRRERLGAQGEMLVAEALDELRVDGYRVIHDVPEEGYNIDHIVIGLSGVYVIETKARSKSDTKEPNEITFDGKHVLVNGRAPDRDPVQQVESIADRVREVIKERLATKVPIRPVILYPGWFVAKQPKGARVWVLNPKAFRSFVRNEPEKLGIDDANRIGHMLTEYARERARHSQ